MMTVRNLMNSKQRIPAIVFLMICMCFGFPAVRPLAEGRVEMDHSRSFESEKAELVRIMNLNLHYILNDWWNSEKDFVYASATSFKSDRQLTKERSLSIKNSAQTFADWRNTDELSILYLSREQAENGIRPVAHAIYCISMALYYGYYEEEIVGLPEEDAEAMCIRLISAVAGEHRANHPEDENDRYWGDSWQSPLWAENIGLGAWLLRDRLDSEIYAKVERMVLDEANTLTYDYEIPYYRDAQGTIVYPGDTKGEEIAWSAKLLALASFMFPDSEELSAWNEKLERMLVSATAMPEDVGSDRIVDGQKVGEMISGSNVNEDGTVVNHDLYHIDYMATILEEMGDSVILYKIADQSVPEAAVFNLDKIYRALIYVDLGNYEEALSGLGFYIRDENGQPTGDLTMPGENDWGQPAYAIYYLCDVMADTLGLDAGIEESCKGHVWKELHFEKFSEQIFREMEDVVTGQFFRPGENFFVSGELFMMHNLVEAYVLQYGCD